MMKLLIFLAVPTVFCSGQVCGPSPEMKTAIEQIAKLPPNGRLNAARELRDAHTDDLWVQREYMNRVQNVDARIAEYEKALAAHSSDAKYLYYLGSALIGVKTPDAIRYLNQALAKDPALASAHARLVTVYASPNFKDQEKERTHLEAYLKACPDSDLEIYSRLERLDAPDLVRASAANLRKALAAREDVNDWTQYRTLWAIEFKAHPPSEYDALREQVRADLERLRKVDIREHRQLAATLREGYKMLSDQEGLKWVDEQVPAAQSNGAAVMAAYQSFNKDHPYPSGPSSREAYEKRNDALLEATAEWVKKWPDEEFAWSQRYQALNSKYLGKSDAAFDEVAEQQLRLAKKSSNPAALKFSVASLYMFHKMHLESVEDLLKEGLADLERRRPLPPSDLYPPSNSPFSMAGMLASKSQGLGYLADYYQSEAKWDVLAKTMAQWRDTMDAQKSAGFPQSFQEDSWKSSYSRYWQKMAALDEHAGRKEEALADYQHALAPELRSRFNAQFVTQSVTANANRLWARMGRPEEDFAAWVEKYAPKTSETASPGASAGQSQPVEANRTLPPFTITDISGRRWTLANLKGKTTLVNLWATWCEPCRKELPLLQKLYDRVQQRKDVVVLTLNTDDNPGMIDPFLKENHYTFPVLPARDYVDSIVPSLAIPRNWIVNKAGVLASVTVGFNPSAGEEWIDKTLQSLENGGEETFLAKTLASLDPGFSNAPAPTVRETRTAPAPLEPSDERPLVTLNAPLPAFTLSDLAGKTWTSTDLHGTTTLINIWATWCGPCRKELPLVQALYDRVQGRSDIRVVTFNIDEKANLVEPFLEKYHYTFPVLEGRGYARSVLMRVSIPRTWMVDKKGIVRSTSTGYSSSTAKSWVNSTLKSLEQMQNGRN